MTDEPMTDEPMTDEPMTDEPMADEPMADENKRAAIIYNYIKRHAPGLLRPGITLTPEQITRIREWQRQQKRGETPEGSA